ncbi:unnamed protein product [Effrenium voratum]|uniref:Uncharacterized protein n=1 Tax=Effrenium voratum TaxID=2562239 RepID=A0AA36MVF2_9DINO|nr:unnamed protein product [Effrenium voratum]
MSSSGLVRCMSSAAGPALDVSGEPRRCSEEDRRRLNAGPNALCASEAVCRDLCAGRHDCHTAQVLTTGEVCYLKPMACERANTWYRDEFYLGFVKSGLPKGCPDIEDTAQLPREPQTTPEPAPAPAPELQPGQPGELFFHTPAPESVEEAAGPAWSATVHFHTSAPSRAPAVAISPPAPTQGGGPPASPAVAPAAWPGPVAPGTPDPATAVARPAAPGAARPGNLGKAGPWPHDPPDPRLTSPDDRWYIHIGKRCIFAGMALESPETCLRQPEREGFKGSFVGGAAALCLDVNRCMALCDATPGCYAVEVSQAVDRCQLKRSSCLMPEHWHNADTNLLVVGRVRHETTTTPEPGPAVQGTLPNRSREHRPTAAQVLLRASRLVEKAAERDAAEQQLRTKAAPQLRKNQVVAEATLQRFAALAEFSLVDITQESSSRSYKYSGAVRRDCTLYLVPFNADSVGIFDTARRSFRTVSIPSSSEFKYSAGVMVGDVAYFVPYAESHIGVFDTATEQFRALDVSWASSAECKYSGALTASSAVYFVPSSAENIGVLDPSSEEFRTIGLGPGADAKWKYHGGVIYDGRCYFAPYNADHIGVLDIASESFHTIDISHAIERDTKFSDAFAQKGVVYFVPFTADGVGAWDVASRRFRLLGLANGGFGGFKFLGAVQVGALSYFVPDSADGVGVFHAATQGFASYDVSARVSADSKFSAGLFFNGAVYLVPRNAHSIGILQVNQSHAHHCPAGTTTQVQVVLGDAGDAGDGLGLLPDGDERYFSGSALPLLSWEAFQALAVILAALLAAELARRAKGESLASCIVAALLPTVLYFVARGLLDLAWPLPAPFWVQMLPASASFLLFWLLFQAVLLWPSANSEDSSARLDWVDLLACMAGLAAADAANAYAQPDTGRSQAAVLAVASALLWGLDSFTGSDSKLRRSPALVLPLALLALEVLSRAVLGFLDIEVLDQEGYLQDGLSHGVPGVGSGLLLAGLSVLLLAVGLALPGEAERAVAVAVATAALAALRAARWLAKSFGLRPDEGHELIFAVVMTALADLALMGLQKMLARTRSGISAEQLGPHGLGLALGLAWASRLLRACAALAPNPSPWALLLALLVALLMLWILAQPRKGQGYSQVKVQPKVKDRCPDAGHLRLYRGIEAAPVLCPPQLSHGEGGELQPGPRLCLEEPGLSLFVDL